MKNSLMWLLILVNTISVLAQDMINLEINITNRNGDIIYIKDMMNRGIREIKVSENGIFKDSFSAEDNFYLLFDGAEYAQLFLKKGYDLKISLDAKDFDNTLKFSGKGEKENNYLAQATVLDQKYDYEGLLASAEDVFNQKVKEKKDLEFAKLDTSNLDQQFVDLQKKNFTVSMQGLQRYYTESQKNKKLNNSKAPTFDYLNHAGGNLKLDDLKGKYVYIDVWATWCGPCVAEIPSLKKVEEKYHDKKIEFVSISVDAEKDFEKWKNFVTQKNLGGIQLYADKSWNSDFIKAFGINAIPRFILIDPNGTIIDADAARPSNPKLYEQLDKLLN